MIEPAPFPADPPPASSPAPRQDPILLEDLAAVVRLPALLEKVARVLGAARDSFDLSPDSPFQRALPDPGDGVHEYGWWWSDPDGLLALFQGMSWSEPGQDPIWEVRVQAATPALAQRMRARGWHRVAARRASGRFSEWDRFWHEDDVHSAYVVGTSAACTRFLEEDDPDRAAAEYLSGGLYALSAAGVLRALLEAARGGEERPPGGGEAGGEGSGGEESGDG